MTALLLAVALVAAPSPRVGAPVDVTRPTRGPVVTLLADVVVSSEVVGDVVAVGGDVELAPGAVVRGDVLALGGSAFGAGTATGRVVSLGGLSSPTSRQGGTAAWGMAMLRVGAWVVLGTLLVLVAPRLLRSTGERVVERLWQTPLAGAFALLVWFVTIVFVLAVAATPLGAACLLLGVGLLLLAKLLGVAAVAWVLGRAAAGWLPPAWRGELPRTGIAILLLSAFSVVPVLGPAVWLVVNVVGVGAVVGALLQRRVLVPALARLAAR